MFHDSTYYWGHISLSTNRPLYFYFMKSMGHHFFQLFEREKWRYVKRRKNSEKEGRTQDESPIRIAFTSSLPSPATRYPSADTGPARGHDGCRARKISIRHQVFYNMGHDSPIQSPTHTWVANRVFLNEKILRVTNRV